MTFPFKKIKEKKQQTPMKKTKKNTRQRQESNDYYVDMKFNVIFFYAMCIVVVFMFQFTMRVIGVVGCAVILVKLVIGMLLEHNRNINKVSYREGIINHKNYSRSFIN